MTFDGTNRKQIREREKAAARADRERIAYVRRIMSDLEGRKWMHTILTSCSLFGSAFVRGSADATAYNLGRQDVGKQMFADLVNYCPTEYFLMMQEAQVQEITNERRDSNEPAAAAGEPAGSPDPGRNVEGPEPDDFGAEPEA